MRSDEVRYPARPLGGILVAVFLLGLAFLIQAKLDFSEMQPRNQGYVLAWFAFCGAFALRDFSAPAARVASGMLTLTPSVNRPAKRFQLSCIQRVQVFSKHVGFTLNSGEYVAVPIKRFRSAARAQFLKDLERFSTTRVWPRHAAA